jgi:hypothetical protein
MSDSEKSNESRVAFELLDLSRPIGTDRGVELSLQLLYLKWKSIDNPIIWESILNAPGPHEKSRNVSETLSKLLNSKRPVDFPNEYIDFIAHAVSIITDFFREQNQQSTILGVFEALCSIAFSSKYSGAEFETPQDLAELLVSLVDGGSKFYDPASGVGAVMSAASKTSGVKQIFGNEINLTFAGISKMRLEMLGFEPLITVGDAFSQIKEVNKFDSVVIQPPWGMQLLSDDADAFLSNVASDSGFRNTPGIRDLSWVFLARQLLNQKGKAALLLPLSAVASRKSRIPAWKFLRDSSAIEAVIALPPGLVLHTNIALAIVLLRPAEFVGSDSILFVDAESFVEPFSRNRNRFSDQGLKKLRRIVSEFRSTNQVNSESYIAQIVSKEEIELEKGFLPSVYLAKRPEEEMMHPQPLESMINNLSLLNFKAYGKEAKIPTAPITLIFGANSAGKSSSIQALRLLKQSLSSSSLITQGDDLDVGGFQGIQHRHEDVPLSIGIEFGSPGSWIPKQGTLDPSFTRKVMLTFVRDDRGQSKLEELYVGYSDRNLHFKPATSDLGLGFKLSAAELDELLVDASGGMLYVPGVKRGVAEEVDATKKQANRESQARRAAKTLTNEDDTTLIFLREGLMPNGEIDSDLSKLAFAGSHGASVQEAFTKRSAKLIAGIGSEFAELLESIVYLGPLRSAPKRMYSRTQDNAASGEGYEAAMYLYDNSNVAAEVNNWLSELEIPYDLAVVPISSGPIASLVGDLVAVVLTDKRSGVMVSPADVGFGISQVLPIVVELLSRRESIICIEQPETHLHPRLQGNLTDLLIASTSKEGSANQVLIETHSEHMVLRLQRRIREGIINPGHVSIVYVDQNSDGQTTTSRLRLNDKGEFIDEWPHGFFDERLDDLFGEFQ